MKTLDIKRVTIPIVMCVLTLSFPFWIYGTNGRFQISSVLFGFILNVPESSISVQLIPELNYILPSLLICAPCFIWLYKQHKMSFLELIGSAGLVLFAVFLVLLIFLPLWSIFPWVHGILAAYVPEFIDLIPISSLAFTIMVLLPLMWRGLLYSEDEVSTRRKKVAAAVLSVVALIIPITTETFSWQGFDRINSFFEGFSLNSATWSLNYRVDGSFMGQNTWFYFSTSSIFVTLSMIIQILPGLLFAWLVCKGRFDQRRIFQMFAAGAAHILALSIVCIWLNYTESEPGRWTIMPVPALLIVGLAIAIVNYGQILRRSGQVSRTAKGNEEERLSQIVV